MIMVPKTTIKKDLIDALKFMTELLLYL